MPLHEQSWCYRCRKVVDVRVEDSSEPGWEHRDEWCSECGKHLGAFSVPTKEGDASPYRPTLPRPGPYVAKLLCSVLKRQLGPEPRAGAGEAGLREWFCEKLEAAMAWGLVVGSQKLSREAVAAARMRYCQGYSMRAIARLLFCSERQVYRMTGGVIRAIAEQMPEAMRASLLRHTEVYRWRLKGCLRCGGDQYLDEQGLQDGGAEWVCLLCSRREKMG